MTENKPVEKNGVNRNIPIILGIFCIVLVIGTVGVFVIENSQVLQLNSDNSKLIVTNTNLQGQNGDLNATISSLQSNNDQLNSTNSQLSSDNAQLTSTNNQLSSDNQQLNSSNSQLTVSNNNLESQITSLNSQISSLQQGIHLINPTSQQVNTFLSSESTKTLEVIPRSMKQISLMMQRHRVIGSE